VVTFVVQRLARAAGIATFGDNDAPDLTTVQMVQYKANTPDAYLSEIDDDWRKERLLEIRQAMFELVPAVAEDIGYGMLRFARQGHVLCHLNAQKSFVGLYLGNVATLDPDGEITSELNVGKGCIRVRKKDSIDVLRTLISRKAAMPAVGGSC
jgi:uncharacterized protein YdhG (YjbR/CyaY superfamily)